MAQMVDMLNTYFRKSMLPEKLQVEYGGELKPEVEGLIKSIRAGKYTPKIIFMSGLKPGKTTSAGMLLREWLISQRDTIKTGVPGYWLGAHQLCYQNRTIDKYHRDEGLQAVIRDACKTDFLVLDGVFSYLTQNDDLLLQSIYDARQHSFKTTIVTTSVQDPLDCAGSILYRIARDADIRITF